MKTETLSIEIPAPKHAILHYLADINNFPEWTTEYCNEFKKEGTHYKITTPMAELYMRIGANEENGEIHYFINNEPDGAEYLPSKVIQINDSRCEYMIEFSAATGISDEQNQQQCQYQNRAIKTKLQNIQNNFKQRH